MFPPKKPGPGLPPDPMGGSPPFPPAGPAGPPPLGGMNPPPMMPKPGQGMDPMMAMLHGIGPDPLGVGSTPHAQGPPLGPNGLPVGGSLPPIGGDNEGGEAMGGSDLLKALAMSVAGGQGDPYATNGQPADLNVGTDDPGMGITQMLQLLALAQMGVGGAPGVGSSGVDLPPFGNMGQMVGF